MLFGSAGVSPNAAQFLAEANMLAAA
jgi:hypothetical protein